MNMTSSLLLSIAVDTFIFILVLSNPSPVVLEHHVLVLLLPIPLHQTLVHLDKRIVVWCTEIRNGVSGSRHPFRALVPFLQRRQRDAMGRRVEPTFQSISGPLTIIGGGWRRAAEPRTVRDPLPHIPNIQHQRTLHRRSSQEPPLLPRILELQPAAIVLEEQREGAPVRMRRHPRLDLRLEQAGGDGRVVQQPQLVVVAGVDPQHRLRVRLRQLQALAQRAQDRVRERVQPPEEVEHEGPEAGEGGVGEPDVGVHGVLLAANFVALL